MLTLGKQELKKSVQKNSVTKSFFCFAQPPLSIKRFQVKILEIGK